MTPRLFGKDPAKERITVVLPPDATRPEWTANSDLVRDDRCSACDGWGSIGLWHRDRAGNRVATRKPCPDCAPGRNRDGQDPMSLTGRIRQTSRSSRTVTPAEEEAARAAGARTLADVQARNAAEHAAGCHGRRCRGGCVQRTRRRWADAGWR